MNNPARRSFERRPREERMAEIETAARTVFAQKGYQAAPMQQIAAMAGVSEGTIYKFYASKSELLYTIISKWYQECMNHHVGQLTPIMDTRIKLETLVRQHMSALVENPDLSSLMFNEVRHFDDYHSSELFDLNRRYAHILMDLLEQGIQQGELRDDVPMALIRDMIFGGIEHHISNFLKGSQIINVRDITRHMVDTIWSGIELQQGRTPVEQTAVLERLEAVADRLENSTGSG